MNQWFVYLTLDGFLWSHPFLSAFRLVISFLFCSCLLSVFYNQFSLSKIHHLIKQFDRFECCFTNASFATSTIFLVWLSAVSDCLQATSYLFFAGLKCVFHTNEPITVSSTSSLTTCNIFLSYLPLRSLCVFATIIIHLWPYWPAGSDPVLSVSVSLLSLYGLFRARSLGLHLLFQPVAKYSVEEDEESSIEMSLTEKKWL